MATSVWCLSFLAFNLLVVITDFRVRRVANNLLLAALVFQIAWISWALADHVTTPIGATTGEQAAIGLGVGLIFFYPLWRFRAIGAGDVKYIAVLGFLLGLGGLIPVLLIGTVACGMHGLGMVLFMGWARARNVWRSNSSVRRGVPYAAYLGLAAVAWLIWNIFEEGLLVTGGG